MTTSRTAASIRDLAAAGDVLTRAWSGRSARASSMRGDLAWWYAQAWPAELGDHLRLREAGGECVGWSWSDGQALDYAVWTGEPARDEAVEREVLEFAIDSAAMRARDGDGDGSVEAWVADDDEAAASLLGGLGFVRADGGRGHARLSQFQRRVDDGSPIGDRPLPAGYRLRTFAGEPEVEARVAAHRAAFAPSRMSVEKYRRLMALPDYRLATDHVVEAPDGSIASFAVAWWDPVARVGAFEPVGTDPRHQRRGLAAALLCHALRRYRDLGAGLVQVFSDADNAPSEALYESVGFSRRAFLERVSRPGA